MTEYIIYTLVFLFGLTKNYQDKMFLTVFGSPKRSRDKMSTGVLFCVCVFFVFVFIFSQFD